MDGDETVVKVKMSHFRPTMDLNKVKETYRNSGSVQGKDCRDQLLNYNDLKFNQLTDRLLNYLLF